MQWAWLAASETTRRMRRPKIEGAGACLLACTHLSTKHLERKWARSIVSSARDVILEAYVVRYPEGRSYKFTALTGYRPHGHQNTIHAKNTSNVC